MFQRDPRITAVRKDDDHDRTKKGDLVVTYKNEEFVLEAKSLQTNDTHVLINGEWTKRINKVVVPGELTARGHKKYRYVPNPVFEALTNDLRERAEYKGKFQCDASDRRMIKFPDGSELSTTCLLVGEFDIVAAGLFGFRDNWEFGYALNRDLPRSRGRNYTEAQRKQLLASSVPITWPLQPPFVSDPFELLEQLYREKQQK